MLYNLINKKVKTSTDCITCDKFNQTTKSCNGLGRYCYEFDFEKGILINPLTHLPVYGVDNLQILKETVLALDTKATKQELEKLNNRIKDLELKNKNIFSTEEL